MDIICCDHHNDYLSIANKTRKQLSRNLAPAAVFGCLGLLLLAACNSGASSPSHKLTSAEAHGKRVFEANCASCHDAFTTSPRNGPGLKHLFKKQYLPSGMPASNENVHRTIVNGRKNMPPFDKVLDDDQVNDVIAYLHTL